MIVKVGGTDVEVRAVALVSMPRLGFTDNFFGWAKACMPLHIVPTKGTGAFWGQVMTRLMEQHIEQAEYLVTLDYDAFFLKEDLEHLFALAMTFQCDALTGLMTKRDDGRPMLTIKGTLDDLQPGDKSTLSAEWFAKPVQEVDTAHFGCTVISTAALKRAAKPWFASTPGPDGRWEEGRTDEDIHFWRNWRACGNRVFVSPRVIIGHGEYRITWPGRDLNTSVSQSTTEFCEKDSSPENAWRAPA